MQGIAYGGRADIGGYSNVSFSTVSMGNVYGPAAGEAVSARASMQPSLHTSSFGGAGMFTIPLMLAVGVLVWYALKTYD